MPDHELAHLVTELRKSIEDSETLAGEDRENLEALARQIDQLVDAEPQGIVDKIGESVSLFETDHPALVQTLNRIAQTLGASGI
jgi:hypothetical protein